VNIRQAENGYAYNSTKTYEHNVGLSCCFRQWRAESHCQYMHGYALKFRYEFEAIELDVRNWAMDFGGLKPLKAHLEYMYDHKTLVAHDDPKVTLFREMDIAGLIQLRIVESAGCEATARAEFEWAREWLAKDNPHITLIKVTCSEHDGNSASYGRSTLNTRDGATLLRQAGVHVKGG
jgi:6-pyruvoyltetrahydropterin/6-carboxytetrahydropterin synthase